MILVESWVSWFSLSSKGVWALNIYLIRMYQNPTTDKIVETSATFAYFSAVGTWTNQREPCKACGWHWQMRIPPLLVQWQPSSNVIGDFSWDGPFGYTFVVKSDVASVLRRMQYEFEYYPVKYVKPQRKRGTVAFPYMDPSLLWVECPAKVDLDKEASAVELKSACSACGDLRYTFRYNQIVIRRHQWHGEKVFRITTNGRSDATFVTEDGRKLIEDSKFSNINFSVAGQITS